VAALRRPSGQRRRACPEPRLAARSPVAHLVVGATILKTADKALSGLHELLDRETTGIPPHEAFHYIALLRESTQLLEQWLVISCHKDGVSWRTLAKLLHLKPMRHIAGTRRLRRSWR